MINLDNINKVFMCDECNSEFEIKYPEDNSKQNYLKCTSCDIQYKIVDGVIIFEKKSNKIKNNYQSKIYSYWWSDSHKNIVYDNEASKKILKSTINLETKDFQNKIVLDAGCGNGRFSDFIVNGSPKLYVLADLSEGIFQAYKKIVNKNFDIVAAKGDLNDIPFKPEVFDIVYSWGVIHHTKNPKKTFSKLSKSVKIEGKFGIYVYKHNPDHNYDNKFLSFIALIRQGIIIEPLRFISQFLSPENVKRLFIPIFYFEKLIGIGIVGCHNNNLKNKFDKDYYFRVVIDRFKTKYASEHSELEIINWYKKNNFDKLIFGSKPKIGALGIKSKNKVLEIEVKI